MRCRSVQNRSSCSRDGHRHPRNRCKQRRAAPGQNWSSRRGGRRPQPSHRCKRQSWSGCRRPEPSPGKEGIGKYPALSPASWVERPKDSCGPTALLPGNWATAASSFLEKAALGKLGVQPNEVRWARTRPGQKEVPCSVERTPRGVQNGWLSWRVQLARRQRESVRQGCNLHRHKPYQRPHAGNPDAKPKRSK